MNTIIKDGPADKAGIRGATTDYYGQKHGGDIITAVDKQNITKMDQLVTFINQNTRPGDTTTITLYRDGHYMDLKVETYRHDPYHHHLLNNQPTKTICYCIAYNAIRFFN